MDREELYDEEDVVLVLDEGVLGVVLSSNAHVSTVLYFKGGLMFEEILENEDFESLDSILEDE